jgi:WD40 repeat protein
MTPALCALLLGLAGFAADDPEPPKPKPKAPTAVSPDKRKTATAAKNVITVTDSQTGKQIMSIRAHTDDVASLSYAPDGKLLASADKGGTLCLFDAAAGKAVWKHATNLKGDGTVAYSPDGKNLTWTVGKTVKTIDAATGKLLR